MIGTGDRYQISLILFLLWLVCATTASADVIFSATGEVTGEGGAYFFDEKTDSHPVVVDGGAVVETGTAAAVLGRANLYSLEAAAGVAGPGDEYSEGLNAFGSAGVSQLFFFQENGAPLLFGTIVVTAQYSIDVQSAGDGGDGGGYVALHGLSEFDDALVSTFGTESGELVVSYAGDLSAGFNLTLEAEAGASGGTFSLGNPGLGAGNAQIRLTSILVNGNEVFAVPEPDSAGSLSLAAILLLKRRRRKERGRKKEGTPKLCRRVDSA